MLFSCCPVIFITSYFCRSCQKSWSVNMVIIQSSFSCNIVDVRQFLINFHFEKFSTSLAAGKANKILGDTADVDNTRCIYNNFSQNGIINHIYQSHYLHYLSIWHPMTYKKEADILDAPARASWWIPYRENHKRYEMIVRCNQ